VTDQELHKLGEVLRTAREAKGVDLARVERDTKIRARYLTALETGDYAELPGPVYTKGFLRNYGGYLGLDTEYLVDLYRLESAQPTADKPTMPVPPRPIASRRGRPLVVTPGAILWALLTVGVAAFIIYLVTEFVTFARTPDLRVTDPTGDVAGYQLLEYRIVGVTEPNSRITVDGLRENPSTTADARGNFAIDVALVPGSNVITLVANDPLTGRDSEPVSRTIVVGSSGQSASPGGIASLASPGDGATFKETVPLRGAAPPGARLTVTWHAVTTAEPSFRITSLAGDEVQVPTLADPPEPQDMVADAEGTFAGSFALRPGEWRVTVAVDGIDEPLVRTVVVRPRNGLHGTLAVRGGASYLEVDQDGRPKHNVSGENASSGAAFRLAAREELRIRAGNAGTVHLEINGIDLGSMGRPGAVVEWRITRL
jgi:cytoskeletal protein RodZ